MQMKMKMKMKMTGGGWLAAAFGTGIWQR